MEFLRASNVVNCVRVREIITSLMSSKLQRVVACQTKSAAVKTKGNWKTYVDNEFFILA